MRTRTEKSEMPDSNTHFMKSHTNNATTPILSLSEGEEFLRRLSENAHLLRYPHPSSLQRTSTYASFLGISEALHLDIFHQPQRSWFFDSF